VVQFRSAVVNIPAVWQHTSTKFDARGTSAISKSVKPFLASIGRSPLKSNCCGENHLSFAALTRDHRDFCLKRSAVCYAQRY
jgi:hypothetical protein